jgi:hypothetical protein
LKDDNDGDNDMFRRYENGVGEQFRILHNRELCDLGYVCMVGETHNMVRKPLGK